MKKTTIASLESLFKLLQFHLQPAGVALNSVLSIMSVSVLLLVCDCCTHTLKSVVCDCDSSEGTGKEHKPASVDGAIGVS